MKKLILLAVFLSSPAYADTVFCDQWNESTMGAYDKSLCDRRACDTDATPVILKHCDIVTNEDDQGHMVVTNGGLVLNGPLLMKITH